MKNFTKTLDQDEAEELMKYLHTQVSPLKPFFCEVYFKVVVPPVLAVWSGEGLPSPE
jgi:hypothetical protein